ncbi:hypothetical protein NDI52_30125 [Leptolyngbya sp. PL-A3]|uniref:hypothetical protein n=1 Tax=Leptolyngbya sp. PL-A3 TaxID=2933911 RepID=UPI0032974449
MSKYDELQSRLEALHLEAASLQDEGECLQDCWLERTPAGGTARGVGTTSGRYRTLRSRKALSGGKKSQYIPLGRWLKQKRRSPVGGNLPSCNDR